MTDKPPSGDIPALTIARFVAAFGVVCFHFLTGTVPPGALRNVMASGSRGVAFFFILSGFILTHVYRRKTFSTRAEWHDYGLRRFARIYPVYAFAWLLTAVFVIVEAMTESHALAHVVKRVGVYGLAALFLVQSWVPGLSQKWNWPGWSLSVEAFFYALFPMLLVASARLSIAALCRWLLVAVFGYAVVTLAMIALSDQPMLPGTPLETYWNIYVGEQPIANLPLFLIGMTLGRLFAAGLRVPHPRLWLTGVLLLLALTLMAGPQAHLGYFHRNLLITPEFAAVVFLLALVHGSAKRPLGRLAVLLGRSSYALYMIQMPCWLLCRQLVWGSKVPTPAAAIGFVACLVAFSIVVHLYLEVPAERAIKSMMAARRASKQLEDQPALPVLGTEAIDAR